MPTSVMPKGVEHTRPCSDSRRLPRMPTSVMPKGVEHIGAGDFHAGSCQMPTSVMPKGVEHVTVLAGLPPDMLGMPTSVMPKGVEHLTPGILYLWLMHAHLCDAERR